MGLLNFTLNENHVKIFTMNEFVQITDVTPRDGLQSHKSFINTKDKKKLIDLLLAAKCHYVEACSFVNPKKISQFHDAEELLSYFIEKDNLVVLVPNLFGLERAIHSGVKNINVLSSASNTFAQKNLGKNIENHLNEMCDVLALARREKLQVRVSLSMAFFCPDEKEIPLKALEKQFDFFKSQGCHEFILCDTCSLVTPDLLARTLSVFSDPHNISLHLHSQAGKEFSIVRQGLELGVRKFESGLKETGGCPFYEGSKNNVSTEELVVFLENLGFESSIDVKDLKKAQIFYKSII